MKCEIRKQESPCTCDIYTCTSASDYEIGHGTGYGFISSMHICEEDLIALITTMPADIMEKAGQKLAESGVEGVIVQELLATVEIYKERVTSLENEIRELTKRQPEPETFEAPTNDTVTENVNKAVDIVDNSLCTDTQEVTPETIEEAPPVAVYTMEELQAMEFNEIKAICVARKLGGIGTKEALITKILTKQEGAE